MTKLRLTDAEKPLWMMARRAARTAYPDATDLVLDDHADDAIEALRERVEGGAVADMREKIGTVPLGKPPLADGIPAYRMVNGVKRGTLMRRDGKIGWHLDDVERLSDPPQRAVVDMNGYQEYWVVGEYHAYANGVPGSFYPTPYDTPKPVRSERKDTP